MATGFITLLDDIALLADDVAMTTKNATANTTGVLADDIAVSAQKATGFAQERELSLIKRIIAGSLKNKLIILPIAFLLSVFLPFLVSVILVTAAFYLLYEGVEKIHEYITHPKEVDGVHREAVLKSTPESILQLEDEKIKSAIRTDFILSIEIIVIALNSVMEKDLGVQIMAVSAVAVIATFGVYGLVAMLIRLDNLGIWLISKKRVKLGNYLIELLPKIIKVVGFLGTAAMLLVGGEILLHNVAFLHRVVENPVVQSLSIGLIGGVLAMFVWSKIEPYKEKILKK